MYAAININFNGAGKTDAIGYSGPTYIAVRSGKHSSSTAFSHGKDFDVLMNLPEFEKFAKHNGCLKPIMIMIVDGGPDENPRYKNTIKMAIHHFVKNNLDALFVACNAPGRSAYNKVERRMAPLSKALSGVILPYDHFGNHLNSQRRTIDDELEKKNFQFAGEVLSEIWSEMIIDKYPVISQYISPESSEISEKIIEKDQHWFSIHVRTSQYMTQIVKCDDLTCCSTPRSSIFKILKTRFLPSPIPLHQSDTGIIASSKEPFQFCSLFASYSISINSILPSSDLTFNIQPYDIFCPSVQTVIKERICQKCGLYFSSIIMLKEHKLIHKQLIETSKIRPKRIAAKRQRELMAIICNNLNDEDCEWLDEDHINTEGLIIPDEIETNSLIDMPLVNINDHLTAQWNDII